MDLLRACAALAEHDVRELLRKRGWHEDGQIAERATIWHHRGNPGAELLVPRQGRVRDYAARMIDLVRDLAEAERSDEEAILRELTPEAVRVRFEIRQRVSTVRRSWLEVVHDGAGERATRDEYDRLVQAHPQAYFELVRIEQREDCLAFTPLDEDGRPRARAEESVRER